MISGNLKFFIGCGLLILLTACLDDDDNMDAPQSVMDKVQAIVDGTAVSSEAELENGVSAWKLEVVTSGGAEVEIYYRQDDLSLIRIDGENGPFNYNAFPGNGLIDFAQALSVGAGQTPEDLSAWRLRREDRYDSSWVYSLDYQTTRVMVDAKDGMVLEVEN